MFFDQIKTIDTNLKNLKTHLQDIGTNVDDQFAQLDDIAAHIIALEALVKELLKSQPVDGEAVKATIKEWTAESSGNADGSQKALTVVEEFISG